MRIPNPKQAVITKNSPQWTSLKRQPNKGTMSINELEPDDYAALRYFGPVHRSMTGRRGLIEDVVKAEDVHRVANMAHEVYASRPFDPATYNGKLAPVIEGLFAPYMGW